MAGMARAKPRGLPTIGKSPTGIRGLDEVTQGGLPEGRPTLAVRLGRLRQDPVRHDLSLQRRGRIQRARRLPCLRRAARRPHQKCRARSTTTSKS